MLAAYLDVRLFESQPTTMEVIGYQRVAHALGDGRPDLAAPDNFYIRTTTKWFLVSDSDAVTPDEKGVRHVHVPGLQYASYSRRSQQGRLRGKIADRFKEVWPTDREALKKTLRTGTASIGAQEFDVCGESRHLTFFVRSVVERVETHTEGRSRVTLSAKESFWSVTSDGGISHGRYVPPRTPMFTAEAGEHVQVDPPVFGYGPVALPRDDDF